MIRGVYMKDGVATEVVMEGMTEIQEEKRELQVFTFPKKVRVPHRRIDTLSIPNAVALGMAVGSVLGCLLIALSATTGAMRIMVLLTIIYNALFFYENCLQKK